MLSGYSEFLCCLYDMQVSDLRVSMKFKRIKDKSQLSEILSIIRQDLHIKHSWRHVGWRLKTRGYDAYPRGEDSAEEVIS